MRRLERIVVLAWVAICGAGCATSALDRAPERADRPWQPATNAAGEIVPGRAGASTSTEYVLPANSALGSGVPSALAIDDSRTYSLVDLIDLAETNNPITRIAWNDARRAALAAGIARSTYLPRITATAVGVWLDDNAHNSVAGDVDASSHGTISAATLQWLLFDFGERAAVIESAEQASIASNIAFTDAHQHVIHAVSLAFYAYSAAHTSVGVATRSRENAAAIQAAAEERNAHGVGTVIEVAQARQASAQAELALVQATGTARDAYLSLLTAVGISPMTSIAIADVSDRPLPPSAAAIDEIVGTALSRRPDVLAAYAAQKASAARVKASEAEFLPKFFVAATGAYNSEHLDVSGIPSVGQESPTLNLSGNHYTGTVVAGLTVPVYDAGVRSAALEQAKADAESAQAKLEHVRDEAVREIVASHNALETSLAAHRASEALASASQVTFDAALDAYRHGVGSVTDTTAAATQLLQAQNASSIAHSAALSAAATLALAMGALGAAP